MSVHRSDRGSAVAPAWGRRVAGPFGRLSLAAALLGGVAGCTASPRYPVSLGEERGGGGFMTAQPRYPISAADAAQNAADVRAGRSYPAYGAAPIGAPTASPYAPPPAPAAPPPAPADDQSDDAPRALRSAPVESSDLPPAAAPADAPPPAAYGAPRPQAISFGGGQIVFGTDAIVQPELDYAAYHHRHHAAAADTGSKSDTAAADTTPSKPSRHHRHGKSDAGSKSDGADQGADAAGGAGSTASGADTPYQTVVRPGEKLSQVAERVHSTKDALIQLNDLKHPKHVKAGTVLKIPYKYSYAVQKGDTLYTISHRFGQDPGAIAKLNGLKAAPTLQPGENLTLPADLHDNGKRDHAGAEGPAPEAAPTKLADAALRKAERKDRRHRHGRSSDETQAADQTQVATAEPTSRHRRGRSLSMQPAAPEPSPPMSAAPTPAPSAAPSEFAAAPPPAAVPPAPAPAPSTFAPSTSAPGYPGRSAAAPAPTYPARSYPPAGGGAYAATAPAASATTGETYAGVRPYSAPATPPAATATPAPSTYAAPGYAARQAAPPTGQVANLTTPRYSSTYPAGGYAPSLGRERPTAETPTAGAVTSAEVATAGKGRFIWPLKGQVTSTFGDKPTGEHNDGMDIAVVPGTAVKAAAAGEVVYAGSAIPGYGNLVLVKHAGGWVTAYAHLDRIEVRMRDAVAQGDEIGQAGQTLAGARPGLHFEVRYAPNPTAKARPVDPNLVLPTG